MNFNVDKLKEDFNNSTDLVIKKINDCQIVYLESLCSGNRINDYILKTLALNEKKDLNNSIVGPKTVTINNYQDIFNYLYNGFTIVIRNKECYAIETKGDLIRSISSPQVQPAILGPKDAFNENIQDTLGLIKRRIKDKDLINKDFTIGNKTQTKVSLVFFKSVTKNQIIEKIENKLNNINVDIIDANILTQLLSENNADFPTIFSTERPDTVCSQLLDGKAAILVDTSPFVLILPAFFTDFINPTIDEYSKSKNNVFIKLLRLICFIITISFPAIYIALINYNHETIPLKLLVSFSIQRDGVPFPAALEAITMLCLCEILRESDIRFPSAYGSAISIIGALILGDAAISAGIVSPIMTIVIAITFISSLVFTEMELVNVLRYYRFFFLLGAILFGLVGVFFMGIIFLIHLCSIKVLDIPYTYPIAPFDKTYLFRTLLQGKKSNDKYRSKILAKEIRKEK